MDAKILLKELELRDLAEKSLHEYTKQAWKIIKGDRQFIDGWHIGAICEHLEAVFRGEIKNLMINVPPRTCKSTLTSVMAPTWVWINRPEVQFAFSSNATSLSERDSNDCRSIIESPWYQSRWGDRYKLSDTQNSKRRFNNDKSGYRLITSINSKLMGQGGDYLVCDDPNTADDAFSETKRNRANEWWDAAWCPRLNSRKKGGKILIMQRLHENDVSGHILETSPDEWVKLILPMEYIGARHTKTIILPSSKGKIWEDPRKEEGELLWPQGMDKKALAEFKKELGSSYKISGQLQQLPSPEGGGHIKKDWFMPWKHLAPPLRIEHVIQSWDCALSEKKSSSYSACTTWGLWRDNKDVLNLILLSMWRGCVEYPELRKIAQMLYRDWRNDNPDKPIKPDGYHIPDICLVEGKSSGGTLIQDLKYAGINAIAFNPDKFGDKLGRVRQVSHYIENGRIWVPYAPPNFQKMRNFADIFVEQCATFPATESQDLVDTMTQVLLRLKGSWLTNTNDTDIIESPSEAEYYGQSRKFY